MKKLLSLALVAVMLLAMVPFAVSAAEVDLIDGADMKLEGTGYSQWSAGLSAITDGVYSAGADAWDGKCCFLGSTSAQSYLTFAMFDEAAVSSATISFVAGLNGTQFWSPVLQAYVDGTWTTIATFSETDISIDTSKDSLYTWTATAETPVNTNQVRISWWAGGWCPVTEIDVYGTPVEGGKTAEEACVPTTNVIKDLDFTASENIVEHSNTDLVNKTAVTDEVIASYVDWGSIWLTSNYGKWYMVGSNPSDGADVYFDFELSEPTEILGAEFVFTNQPDSGIGQPWSPKVQAWVDDAWVTVGSFDMTPVDTMASADIVTLTLSESALPAGTLTSKVRITWWNAGWVAITDIAVYGTASGIMEGPDFGLRYYENGERQYALGLVEYGEGYIYVTRAGEVVTGEYWVTADNGTGLSGIQYFDENGIMTVKEGFVTEDDGSLAYYYAKNKKAGYLGLTEIDGALYYINSNNQVMTGEYWVTKDNGLGYVGIQTFDETGKMVITEGIIDTDGDGALECWVKNRRVYAHGLIEIDGSYYYIDGNANVVADCEYYVTNDNGLGYAGVQTFGADGAMVIA